MEQVYLVRYGVMGHVGRFPASLDLEPFERGQPVILRTHRGTELGEVLATATTGSAAEANGSRVLRAAGSDDIALSRRAGRDRAERLDLCERLFSDGVWPIVLVDVEPLLDDGRTVLYYLGPHRLDDAGLREFVRDRCGLEAVLEPVGRDEPVEAEDSEEPSGCGSCGTGGGCGSGGCGSSVEGAESHGGGCSGCSVKELVRSRRR